MCVEYVIPRHGWTGLLVEAHPIAYTLGLTKQRKAHHINTCLSTKTRPETVFFDTVGSIRNETHRSLYCSSLIVCLLV